MSYAVMALLVWLLINVLEKMTTCSPTKGISVPCLTGRFTEPKIGFAASEFECPGHFITANES